MKRNAPVSVPSSCPDIFNRFMDRPMIFMAFKVLMILTINVYSRMNGRTLLAVSGLFVMDCKQLPHLLISNDNEFLKNLKE